MKNAVKILISAVAMATMLTGSVAMVSATQVCDTPIDEEVILAAVVPGDSPCGDEIVWKIRYVNGVRQKRRWNETKKCWVDPYWINA